MIAPTSFHKQVQVESLTKLFANDKKMLTVKYIKFSLQCGGVISRAALNVPFHIRHSGCIASTYVVSMEQISGLEVSIRLQATRKLVYVLQRP